MLQVGTVQFQHRAGDKAYNLERVRHFCEQASVRGVRLLAFPEMCIPGYWHVRNLSRTDIEALAERIPDGETTRSVLALAHAYDMLIGVGLIELGDDGLLYNTYIVCFPDGRVEKHRKLHCFISEHMASGASFTVFGTPFGVNIGVLICWDNNLIENARATALKGADILLAPHQTGGTASRSPHAMGLIEPELWENRHNDPEAIEAEFRGDKGRGWLMRWLPARAHDNGMFVLFSNGVGLDDNEVRTGNAMIIDCYGRIVNETCRAQDDMVIGELDLELLPLCTGRRWMRGRRPELYGLLAETQGNEIDARQARFSERPTSESG